MNMIRKLAFGALALVAIAALQPIEPAEAAFGRVLCRPDPSGAAAGPGSITNPNTNTTYGLDSAGCVFFAQADIGWALSQGFTSGVIARSVSATLISAQNFGSLVIPAGAYIYDIVVQETSGASITGGLKFGSTAGGSDIATGVVCGSSCLTGVKDVSMAKRVVSTTAPTTVGVDAVSSWNSAAVSVTVLYWLF